MPEVTIALMTREDVRAVSEIERQCFAIPWSYEAFVREVTENKCARYVLVKEDGVPVAYAGVWFVIDEGHITNVAVRKDRRRLGYGEKVVRAMMQLAADSGMRYLTLEVRKGNVAARSLYRKVGFIELGVRKRYYEDNGEDALILVCDHLPEAHPEDDPLLAFEE